METLPLFIRDLEASLLKASFFYSPEDLHVSAWHRSASPAVSLPTFSTLVICFCNTGLPPMLTHWSPTPPFSPGLAPSWCPFLLSIWLRLLTCRIDFSIGKSSSLTLLSIYCNSWNNLKHSIDGTLHLTWEKTYLPTLSFGVTKDLWLSEASSSLFVPPSDPQLLFPSLLVSLSLHTPLQLWAAFNF